MTTKSDKTSIKNYKIYVLYNDVDDDTYIGVTSATLKQRLKGHYDVSKCKNSKICRKIRELGCENIKIVEHLSADTDWVDAHRTEGEFIEFFKPTLNTFATGLFLKDDGSFCERSYREVNKDKVRERHKGYYKIKVNKDRAIAYGKEYRKANRDKSLAYFKRYHEVNRDKALAHGKKNRDTNRDKIREYREANRDKSKAYNKKYYEVNKEIFSCDCGSVINRA